MKISLKRIAYLETETFGVLCFNGIPKMVTLEDPWKDNAKNISCIPTGDYLASRYQSKKFGETFIVENVPGRSGILFHAGNTTRDTQGCILLGRSYGELAQQNAILGSHLAFHDFLIELKGLDSFRFKVEI